MPPPIDPSRDLLFGLLALQNGLINQIQLVTAFQAWTLDKACALADHLILLGHLNAAQRAVIEAMADLHVAKHGDVERSLAAIPAGLSTHESLARLGDPDIEGTLAHVQPPSTRQDGEADADRTTSYAVGSATSEGQRFRVLRPHARGGLGAVFVALDTELHREVALKQILDSHADEPTSRQRFLLEAEVTGGLEHPGIVPVYGLGTYGDGRPYYAMRFIRGDSLKEAIDGFHADAALKSDPGSRSLELRKLLRRLTDVCNAIEYAHSRGVLHRDIKPGNVIVGKHGETLVVDWGLAKASGKSDPGSGEGTLMPSSASGSAETLPGSVLGTPAYMSPEQAEGDLEHLGPRSDVYSLGATLYYLLTGKPPVEGDAADVIRCVQKGRFPPPRQIDPTIDRAVESVCLKAMALKPPDRYGSPKALAEDVERWMANEPVSAWREPWTVSARRRLARHRTLMAATAAAIPVAMAGLAAVLVVQAQHNQRLGTSNAQLQTAVAREQRAVRQMQTAIDREIDTNRRLTIAHASEQNARQQREEQFALALDAVENATQAANDNALLDPTLGTFHRQNLEKALGFYKRLRASLEKRAMEDAKTRADLAMAYHRMATISGRLGAHDEAREAFGRAIALRARLVRDEPRVVQHVRDLASSYAESGGSLCGAGRSAEGLDAYGTAVALWERLTREYPGLDASASLGRTLNALGHWLVDAGSVDQALEVYRRAHEIWGKLAREHPEVPQYRAELAATLRKIGGCHALSGRSNEALEAYAKSQALLERQVEDNPTDLQSRSQLAIVINNIGNLHLEQGRPEQSLPCYQRYLAIHLELVKADPTNAHYRQMLAYAHSNFGAAQYVSARFDAALQSYRDALVLLQALTLAYPGRKVFQDDLSGIHARLATAYAATGRAAEAQASMREAERVLEQVPVPTTEVFATLASGYAALSWSVGPEQRRGYADRAIAALRRAVAGGWRSADELKSDPNFAPLRSRSDYEALLMDLSFPDDPFAPKN
jgi:serine/threonine-protein kinase